MSADEPQVDVDVLAAALRSDARELEQFAEILAGKLESALPSQTRVERRRSGLLGPRRVARILITLASEQLELLSSAGALQATSTRISGGIALKHERLDLDDWVARLSGALAQEAQRSEQARRALSEMLI